MRGFFGVSKNRVLNDIYPKPKKESWFWSLITKRLLIASFLSLFLVILVISGLGLIFKKDLIFGQVQASGQLAQEHFLAATAALSNFDLTKSKEEFGLANQQFESIEKTLDSVGFSYTYLDQIESAQNDYLIDLDLLKISHKLSIRGENLINQLINLNQIKSSDELWTKTADLTKEIALTQETINESQKRLSHLSPTALSNQEKIILQFQDNLEKLNKVLADGQAFLPKLTEILAKEKNKKYLFLFQNPREARPTGGLVGSWGEVKLENGKMADLKVSDINSFKFENQEVYNLDITKPPADFPSQFDQSPELKKINPYPWAILDGNWLTDFSVVSQKMEWLFAGPYQHESVDGVIAFDPDVLTDLIKITGPIEMPDYNLTLNENNFWDEIEKNIELDSAYMKGNHLVNPKQILIDLTPILMERITKFDERSRGELAAALLKNLTQKHLLLYFNDPGTQKIVSTLGWSGEVAQTSGDYLEVNVSNFNSGKTSRSVTKEIKLNVEFLPDGSALNTLELNLAKKPLVNQALDQKNVSYLKIMTPARSQLIKAWKNKELLYSEQDKSLIDTYLESNKTIFGYANEINTGEIETLIFQYQTPLTLDPKGEKDYSLQVQKQPGTVIENLLINFTLPDSWSFARYWPPDIGQNSNFRLKFETTLDKDKNFKFSVAD